VRDYQQTYSKMAVDELRRTWGGRIPTWEEFKAARKEGRMRIDGLLAGEAVEGRWARWTPNSYFGPVTALAALLVLPAAIGAHFFLRTSGWWILGSAVAAWCLYKVSKNIAIRGVETAAEANPELYYLLVNNGAFQISPPEAGVESKQKIEVSRSELGREVAKLGVKALAALAVLLVYSIVQLFRLGNQSDYLFLLVGSLASSAAITGYVFAELTYGVSGRRSFLAMLLVLAGFIPWAFGSYVVFVSGFWSLKNLKYGFSMVVILKAMVLVWLGYAVVKNFWKITEVGVGMREGAFNVREEPRRERRSVK
jgi:hypothetical protein